MSLLILITMLVTGATFADDETDDDTGRDDRQVYHVFEGIDMVSQTKIQYGKSRIVIKSVFPQLESDQADDGIDSFNEIISSIVQEEVNNYRDNVANNHQHQINIPTSQLKNNLYIDYDTSSIKSGDHLILSIRFSIQGFLAGMPTPYHVHRTFNYDVNDHQALELKDLFSENPDYLNAMATYATQQLQKHLANNQLLMAGLAPTEDNYKNWNIKPTGILITFDEYQVAPKVKGAQTVLIPYTTLKAFIPSDSPIASCIKHKSACTRNNVLTGGFIDQAQNVTHQHTTLVSAL